MFVFCNRKTKLGPKLLVTLLMVSTISLTSCAGLSFTWTEITDASEQTTTAATTQAPSTVELTATRATTELPTSTTTTVTSSAQPTTTPEPTTNTLTNPTTKATTKATTKTPVSTTTVPVVSPDGRSGSELDTPFTYNGIIVVNKQHWVSRRYQPLPESQQNVSLVEPAWTAWKEMRQAAAAEGISLVKVSTYRSYNLQEQIFNRWVKQEGEAQASRHVARPGQSEHQTGLAIDIGTEGISYQSLATTPAGKWLWANAYKYGFILRYPSGKEHITGYYFEPWHYRYVGELVAADFGANSTLTLEEYIQGVR